MRRAIFLLAILFTAAGAAPAQIGKHIPVRAGTPEDRMLAEIYRTTDPGQKLELLEEFLEPTGLSQYRLAKDISVPPRRINEIVHGKRAVTADTALRLARYFGTTPRFWLNLQAQYDLDVESDRLGDRLDLEVAAHAR